MHPYVTPLSYAPTASPRLPLHRRRHGLFPHHPPLLSATDYLIDMVSSSSFLRRNMSVSFFLFSLFLVASLYCLLLLRATDRIVFFLQPFSLPYLSGLPSVFPSFGDAPSQVFEEYRLEQVLKDAATKDGTVILTTLNEAWSAPNSVIDLFLESFRNGDGTRWLLNHLVIIALDKRAFSRCAAIHSRCFALVTKGVDFSSEAYFMAADYLKMMWRRIEFLRSVLVLGYNFIFTDADIMWLRDPFPRFFSDVDVQIACDHFVGDPDDIENKPNGGFNYVKSNNRTIQFYEFWYSSREIYQGYHDQDVLNFIKYDHFLTEMGLRMRFLDTAYFGGLCEPSKDLNQVCTMHANCCFGLASKLHDLRIMLQDWKIYMSLPPTLKSSLALSWRVPQNCSLDSLRQNDSSGQITQ